MSGILRRTAMMSKHKGGIYDFGWRRVVTEIGGGFEPTPVPVLMASTAAADYVYNDMIGHVDDIEMVEHGNWSVLGGMPGDVQGGENGIVHQGTSLAFSN